ncbi:MAG: hypothetical protein LBS30_04500 [Planctomycetota bacterium]|nr:hypothetical protein [Planctomycetota bacterium]
MIHDGRDYRELLDLARSGKIAATRPKAGSPEHHTLITEYGGKKYVVKKAMRQYHHFDSRLKYRLFGSPFFSTMKKVEKAIENGCDRIQRIYLLEETAERDRKKNAICVNAWIVLDYLPGDMLLGHKDAGELIKKIPGAIEEIHGYKLVQLDCNLGNFIVSEGRIKIIDIFFTSNPFFGPACRAVRKLKKAYNLDIPVNGVANRIVFAFAGAVYSGIDAWRSLFRKERRR